MSSTTAPPRKPTASESLFCGVVAGCIEGGLTYPAEYVKTKMQSPGQANRGIVAMIVDTVKTRGVAGLYAGAGAQIAGTGLKAGVRFMTYDTFKEMLRTDEGKLTPGRTMVAGLAAGTVEAVIAVTPSETIKTKLIQDAARPQPLYTSTLDGTVSICRTEGFGGIYRGLGPTILKQASNSAVRFTSFAMLQSVALETLKPASGKLSATTTFATGALAGLITVYTTMPIDNVKTRMQSLGAGAKYRNSLDCLVSIVRHEGVQRLWSGTTPRLARLMLSGGIVFSVYETLMGVMLAL